MPDPAPFPVPEIPSPTPIDDRRSPGDPARLAALVATGELPFPAGLAPAEAAALAAEVRRLRRARLVRLVAGVIARDLLREAGP